MKCPARLRLLLTVCLGFTVVEILMFSVSSDNRSIVTRLAKYIADDTGTYEWVEPADSGPGRRPNITERNLRYYLEEFIKPDKGPVDNPVHARNESQTRPVILTANKSPDVLNSSQKTAVRVESISVRKNTRTDESVQKVVKESPLREDAPGYRPELTSNRRALLVQTGQNVKEFQNKTKEQIKQTGGPSIRVQIFDGKTLENVTNRTRVLSSRDEKAVSYSTSIPKKRVITMMYPAGRLGNQMFCFASFIGIASARDMEPQLFGKYCGPLRKYFNITVHCNERLPSRPRELERFVDSRAAIYDKKVEKLSNDPDARALALTGYMQSWKYFDKYRDKLLKFFTFKKTIIDESVVQLREHLVDVASAQKTNIKTRDVILVGVHVRRTDMTSDYSHKRGYVEAPKEYIKSAMEKMESLLNTTAIIYVVVSDDLRWCVHNINNKTRTVVFYRSGKESVDLAMLSGCDHSIITSGTYGWWGAYLAGGKTIYFSKYPKQGSYIAKITSPRDYYPPSWVGIP